MRLIREHRNWITSSGSCVLLLLFAAENTCRRASGRERERDLSEASTRSLEAQVRLEEERQLRARPERAAWRRPPLVTPEERAQSARRMRALDVDSALAVRSSLCSLPISMLVLESICTV